MQACRQTRSRDPYLWIYTVFNKLNQDGNFLFVQSCIKECCYFVHNVQGCVGLSHSLMFHCKLTDCNPVTVIIKLS